MKFFVAIILTSLLSFVAGIYIKWWWFFAVIAFLVALLVNQRAGKSFLSGFLGLFLLWAGLAWWIDIKNESVLSVKIAELLPLGGSAFALILITGLLGGLIAGFAAMSAGFLRTSISDDH